MAEENVKVYSQEDTALRVNAVGKWEVTIVSVCAAAPAMCIGGSMGLIALQTGWGISLSAALATLAVVLIGLSYGKLSEKYNRCGGTWSYIQQSIGQKAGLWTAFVYFGVLITTSGCPPSIFSIYMNYLFPAIPMWAFWFVVVGLVCFLTWWGVELSTRITVLIWIVQMALLVWPAIKIIAMAPQGFEFGPSLANSFTPSLGIIGLGLAAVTWVWAYVGFEYPAYMGEELKGGSKSVKFAIPISGLMVGVIYVIACWLWMAAMTEDQLAALAGSGTFLADYATMIGYAAGDTLVAWATIISAFACAMAFYSLMPRFLFDLGREGILPKGLAKVNKHQVPYVAMFTYAAIAFCTDMYAMYGYSANGLFDGINDWFVIMGFTACTAYATICIANIYDGRKDTSASGIWLRKVIPVITTALLAYMVISSILTIKYFLVFLFFVIGGIVFAFARRNAKKPA